MKQINMHAPVTCKKSIQIEANSQKVWSVLTNINEWANWQTDIRMPALQGPLQPNATFDWKTGGAKIHSTLHTVEPFKNFGWTGKTFGMYTIHNWVLTDLNRMTEVLVEESMEGLLASLFKKSFNRNLEKSMQKWLDLLKLECER